MSETKSYTIKNTEKFCEFLQEQVDAGTSVVDGLQAFQDQQPKIPGEGEGVIVILNYGPKSHAIFGADTKPVKDGLMALNTEGKKDVVSFNGKLEFGAGWVVTNKTKLPAVLDFLDENEISHTKIEREAFVNGETVEAAPKAKKAVSKGKAKDAPAPKGKAKVAPKEESEDEAEEVDLSSMKLPQLKALAKEAGLAVTGTKDELIERIEQHKAGGDEEAPEEDEGKTLSKMKIDDLKDILRNEELSTTGTKDVLIARILSHRKGNDATPGKASKAKAPAKGAKAAPAKGKSKAAPTKPAPKGKVAPKPKAPAKGKAAPKAKVDADAPVKVVAKKNDHGNFVEEDTGLVFVEAPVGTGGRKAKIVVGVQDPDSEETGIASVKPLDADMIAECEERKWQYLTDDMLVIIAKKDSELHEQLVALQARGEEGEDAGEDVPEGEEGEAVEDAADEEEEVEDEE